MKIGAYKWNGKTISLRAFRRRKLKGAPSGVPMVARAITLKRPQTSIGMAVLPDQVHEFNALYADAGISGAYHRKDGTCVLESRLDRKKAHKLRGIRDNDAGYGDHAGDN